MTLKLVYTHDIFTFQKFGGISRYFVEIIRRIARKVPDTRVFAGFYINEYLRTLAGVARITGIRVPVVAGSGRIGPALNALMYPIRMGANSLGQRISLRPDRETIVHLSDYTTSLPGGDGKVVVTAYDMIQELFPDCHRGYSAVTLRKKVSFERADKIIAISECTKKDLMRLFGIDEKKITVIHLASSLDSVSDSNPGVSPGLPYILFVGDRSGYKNFKALARAYGRSPVLQANFGLISFGGGGFTPEERREFEGMGVSHLISHAGGDDTLLARYYRNARAFVWPSLYEGFGIPLLEAMDSDCPVLCSNAGPMPEVAGDAAVYFDPGDVDEIRHVLETTLLDDGLLKKMVELGHKRVKQFSWDKAARETLDLYRSLM